MREQELRIFRSPDANGGSGEKSESNPKPPAWQQHFRSFVETSQDGKVAWEDYRVGVFCDQRFGDLLLEQYEQETATDNDTVAASKLNNLTDTVGDYYLETIRDVGGAHPSAEGARNVKIEANITTSITILAAQLRQQIPDLQRMKGFQAQKKEQTAAAFAEGQTDEAMGLGLSAGLDALETRHDIKAICQPYFAEKVAEISRSGGTYDITQNAEAVAYISKALEVYFAELQKHGELEFEEGIDADGFPRYVSNAIFGAEQAFADEWTKQNGGSDDLYRNIFKKVRECSLEQALILARRREKPTVSSDQLEQINRQVKGRLISESG